MNEETLPDIQSGQPESILDNPVFVIFLASTLIFFCAIGTLGKMP